MPTNSQEYVKAHTQTHLALAHYKTHALSECSGCLCFKEEIILTGCN